MCDESTDYHQTFAPEQKPITEQVCSILAAFDNQPVTEMQPLYEVFDPEAFARVLASGAASATDSPVQIEFDYDGLTVVVASSGDIWITDSQDIVTERNTDD